jgi:hypothetical protein
VDLSIIIGFGGIVVGVMILWTMVWYFERRDRADARKREEERSHRRAARPRASGEATHAPR